MTTPLLVIKDLVKDYPLPKKHLLDKAPAFRALRGINLTIDRGVSYGVVGESGCGKSTLAKLVMALDTPTEGSIFFQGADLFQLGAKQLRALRQHFQMVFQDPYESLNPRKTILRIVAEPLWSLKKERTKRDILDQVRATLVEVGLAPSDVDKFPHEFSGGQRQRVAIARALITRPSLIVVDEPISALDVSIQAQVLNLMMDLQEKFGLTYLFISHDLSVVEYITDEIAVIYNGKIVEKGQTPTIFQNPLHPYTQTLMAAIPNIDPHIRPPKTIQPAIDLSTPKTGCPFRLRCRQAADICEENDPELQNKNGRLVACHLA